MSDNSQCQYVEFNNILIGEGQKESPTKSQKKQNPTYISQIFEAQAQSTIPTQSSRSQQQYKNIQSKDHLKYYLNDSTTKASQQESEKHTQRKQVQIINAESKEKESENRPGIKCDPTYSKNKEQQEQKNTKKHIEKQSKDQTTEQLFGNVQRQSLKKAEVKQFQPNSKYELLDKERIPPEQLMKSKQNCSQSNTQSKQNNINNPTSSKDDNKNQIKELYENAMKYQFKNMSSSLFSDEYQIEQQQQWKRISQTPKAKASDLQAQFQDWTKQGRSMGKQSCSKVNESVQFDRSYAYQKKLNDNCSSILSPQIGYDTVNNYQLQHIKSQRNTISKKEGISKFFDNENTKERQFNRNFSDLNGFKGDISSLKQGEQSQSQKNDIKKLLPSNLKALGYDSSQFKGFGCVKPQVLERGVEVIEFQEQNEGDKEAEKIEQQKNSNESEDAKKTTNDKKKLQQKENGEKSELQLQQQNQKEGDKEDKESMNEEQSKVYAQTEMEEEGKPQYSSRLQNKAKKEEQKLQQQTEQTYGKRYALWKQKMDQNEKYGYKNVKVYQVEFKGLSEKFDSDKFSKICLQNGYHVVNLNLNLNSVNSKPSGRGALILRNKRKYPDPLTAVAKQLEANGLTVISVKEFLNDSANDCRPKSALFQNKIHKSSENKKSYTKKAQLQTDNNKEAKKSITVVYSNLKQQEALKAEIGNLVQQANELKGEISQINQTEKVEEVEGQDEIL